MTEEPESTDAGNSVDEFVRLISLHQRRVHAYIAALLPVRSDADDVMQETSLALWRKWKEFDPSREFFRWACGVAHIEVLRHRRNHMNKRLFFNEELMAEIAEEVLRQPELIEMRGEALATCLQKLGRSDRRLIDHRYGQGVTAIQTATDLGRPTSTVYKALARIRRALRACITRRLAEEFSS